MTDNAHRAAPAPQIIYVQQPTKRRSGLSIAALVLGALALVLGAVPILGWLVGSLLAILAIVFGIIGAMLDRNSDLSDKMPFAGILLGILALIGVFALGMGTVW
jgi:cytochrome b561